MSFVLNGINEYSSRTSGEWQKLTALSRHIKASIGVEQTGDSVGASSSDFNLK